MDQKEQQISVFYYSENETIPLEILNRARIQLAHLYKNHGEEIIPLFIRLEQEISKTKLRLENEEKIKAIISTDIKHPST